jgi:diamine N-acetyltransferase
MIENENIEYRPNRNNMIGDKVLLRAMEPEDVEILYNWENDTSVWQLSTTIAPLSRYMLEQYVLNTNMDIYSSRQLRMMIDLKEEVNGMKTIGSVDLFEFEPSHMRAGIGILVHKDFRGRGLASEAIDLLIHYAFQTLQLHQVFCNISTANTDSLNLFKSKGFEYIGTKKQWNRFNNHWHDEAMFQMINNNSDL